MPDLLAVTVVSRSHLPLARVLSRSLSDHSPAARLVAVVVDQRASEQAEPFEVLTPLELGIDTAELHRRAAIYDAQGLISSLRSLALQAMLARGADSALLLDADMLVVGALDDLWDLADRHGVLLSPHATVPLAGRPGSWREEPLLAFGTFNGGFLGVGRGGGEFLDWVAARAARDCVPDRERGLIYTQTWLNLVPVLFPCHILRDPGVNCNAYGLDGRDLEEIDGVLTASGAPLRLFHFTGFDAGHPQRLARAVGPALAGLEDRPHLARLCVAYAAMLRAEGWPSDAPYGWAQMPDGSDLLPAMRAKYREGLLVAAQGLEREPPNPFTPEGSAAFRAWYAEVAADRRRQPRRVRRVLASFAGR